MVFDDDIWLILGAPRTSAPEPFSFVFVLTKLDVLAECRRYKDIAIELHGKEEGDYFLFEASCVQLDLSANHFFLHFISKPNLLTSINI